MHILSFIILLEDGNDVAGKIFDRGGEGDLDEVICKGWRGELNNMSYCIQSGDCKKVLYHNYKLSELFWDSRLGGEGNMVYRRWWAIGGTPSSSGVMYEGSS